MLSEQTYIRQALYFARSDGLSRAALLGKSWLKRLQNEPVGVAIEIDQVLQECSKEFNPEVYTCKDDSGKVQAQFRLAKYNQLSPLAVVAVGFALIMENDSRVYLPDDSHIPDPDPIF